ncbi:MAG TPA: beta-propeller fold lactonase family protein [Candidatus Dormibacteraeota bacterium]|nr:beta-propeller fold lactonase family protein [Candidatus Dormibacteraeota bacterium]
MTFSLRCPRILPSVGLLCLALLAITKPSAAQKFAYVTNHDSNNVSAYGINANGSLTLVPGSPFPTGNPLWPSPSSVAVDPTGQFVYVVGGNNSGKVSAYKIVSTPPGALMLVGTQPAGANPLSVAVDPDGQFVYVGHRGRDGPTTSEVWAYTINADGSLTPVPCSPFPAGGSPGSVAVDPTGQFVYVGHTSFYFSNTISAYVIKRLGGLVPLGGLPGAGWQLTVDPTGQFLYVANGGGVSAYRIDFCTGALTFVGTYSTGLDAFSVAVDPTGQFVYVVNGGNNNVSAFTINGNGSLTVVAGSPFANHPGGSGAYSVAVDSTGSFVYVTNVVSNNVSAYQIDTIGNTGALTKVPGSPFANAPSTRGAFSVATTP